MNYDIIATLGPSSETESIWQAMIASGVTGFRLNTSHLSLPQLHSWLERLSNFLFSQAPHISLVLDLQGSKWRLGSFSAFTLNQGQTVELIHAVSTEQPDTLPIPHPDFFQAAVMSRRSVPALSGAVPPADLALNDARILLQITAIHPQSVTARVVLGGFISPNKGITYIASDYSHETLSEKDQTILAETYSLKFIRYAISYIKDAVEMAHYRTLMGTSASLIAKLERQPALDDALEITRFANELWLCRGDLGAELGLKSMAEQVTHFSRSVPLCPRPVLMAGQVLEHMTEHAIPTRSEVCFLYESLVRGYRGVVLSDETAIGSYPVAACQAAALFTKT